MIKHSLTIYHSQRCQSAFYTSNCVLKSHQRELNMCALDLAGYLERLWVNTVRNKKKYCPLSEHCTVGVLLDKWRILSQSLISINCLDMINHMYLLCNVGSCFSVKLYRIKCDRFGKTFTTLHANLLNILLSWQYKLLLKLHHILRLNDPVIWISWLLNINDMVSTTKCLSGSISLLIGGIWRCDSFYLLLVITSMSCPNPLTLKYRFKRVRRWMFIASNPWLWYTSAAFSSVSPKPCMQTTFSMLVRSHCPLKMNLFFFFFF